MNPNFLFNPQVPGTDPTAIAVQTQLTKEAENMASRWNPVTAMLHENELNVNKSQVTTQNQTFALAHAISFETVPGLTANTLGVHPGYIPTGFPNYDVLNKYTQAVYDVAFFERALVITAQERLMIKNGMRMNIIDEKIRSMMNAWANAVEDMATSDVAGSPTRLMGLYYPASVSNNVGGISQAAQPLWRARVTPNVGQITIDDYIDIDTFMREKSRKDNKPRKVDHYICDSTAWRATARFISSDIRVVDTEFDKNYGLEAFRINGKRCLHNPGAPDGTVLAVDSKTLYWDGQTSPVEDHNGTIPGTTAREHVWYQLCCMSTKDPGGMNLLTEVTL